MELKETFKSREELVEGVLLHVFRDTVTMPNGTEAVREWIAHPGASAVVPLFEDGSTVLVRQFRYPPQRTFLEVPAGKLDMEGEDPEDVARRELEEEAGFSAKKLTSLGKTYPCIGYSNEVIYLFLAEDLEEAESELEADELVEPVRMPFAEAVAMAKRGEILDVKSAIALIRAGEEVASRAARGS
jgi:ADP-ribose pyrophosphatase